MKRNIFHLNFDFDLYANHPLNETFWLKLFINLNVVTSSHRICLPLNNEIGLVKANFVATNDFKLNQIIYYSCSFTCFSD